MHTKILTVVGRACHDTNYLHHRLAGRKHLLRNDFVSVLQGPAVGTMAAAVEVVTSRFRHDDFSGRLGPEHGSSRLLNVIHLPPLIREGYVKVNAAAVVRRHNSHELQSFDSSVDCIE